MLISGVQSDTCNIEPTELYLGFHSPALYEVHKFDIWSRWYSKLLQLELNGIKNSYFSERVSHASNLLIENNKDRWEMLIEEFNGQVINILTIHNIVSEWQKLYNECKMYGGKQTHKPTDMFTSGQIKIILKKYIGYHLVFNLKEESLTNV